jgi:large subunit ribosomal protein L4
MATVEVLNMNGEKVSDLNLADSVFGIEPNVSVMHTVVVNYLANQRQGTQSTLTRSEVRGGGRKPWRQKGTGHARQGSTRAPQWTHGGIALGPKPRDYSYTINKKVKRLAMKSALSSKVIDNKLVVIDEIKLDEFSTKKFAAFLEAVKADTKTLVVLTLPDKEDKEAREAYKRVVKSAANIADVQTTNDGQLNVYDILKYDKCILVKDAVATIEEVYAE